MYLISKILSDQTVTALASIILIVAALPMAGWSWAVNQMAGKWLKEKGGYMKAHLSFLCNGRCQWCKNYWDCSKAKRLLAKILGCKDWRWQNR